MTGYWQANLKDMIKARGEEAVQTDFSEICCPLNPDVEYFIRRDTLPGTVSQVIMAK